MDTVKLLHLPTNEYFLHILSFSQRPRSPGEEESNSSNETLGAEETEGDIHTESGAEPEAPQTIDPVPSTSGHLFTIVFHI